MAKHKLHFSQVQKHRGGNMHILVKISCEYGIDLKKLVNELNQLEKVGAQKIQVLKFVNSAEELTGLNDVLSSESEEEKKAKKDIANEVFQKMAEESRLWD
ncbi:MAG: hypothetical protein A3B74_01810 [Candidatus Kerfeldbacteria bacterium RIFCSPHIGHO2_02_FULL_42_14]|uniref:Uncharacterized protein n=1 Tax=Candidatus Kerfeldbacteria bacterium RIFCSPHIGHO2_02_FULL_42_14 TaxID=1798540 RepID=A0A1G2ATA3_9BACT|nr:MAG: hypothetical protein A3B74_01810 [Candidatus Kerfeldbacteria bacterium RIFCSPHIGHO2_02_FULL_42_14]OGY82723.1 MAG: hypothetical protein A3I91_01030 [Candidatus Kerfeldbacteria bacterium RIFCSPLOWO2_02_FULL_42_19]